MAAEVTTPKKIHTTHLLDGLPAGTDLRVVHRDEESVIRSAEATQAELEAAVAAYQYDEARVRQDELDGTVQVDRTTIKADGVDAALVTAWRFSEPGPVTFVVNGVATDVALTDGAAELVITAAQPGPIEVTANGKTVIITAEGA